MLTPVLRPTASFGRFVADAAAAGELVVQSRMGFSAPARMRAGLAAVKAAPVTSVGTITLDSYTRVGDHRAARRALDAGAALNGYPIVAHDAATTLAVLDGIHGAGFPVQVRHGSAAPHDIIVALGRAGLHATEGGPVSYCLPYGRVPLRRSVDNWARSCALLAGYAAPGVEPHLETFGGCMLGQLCPPSLLVAISVLEAIFFRAHGLRSVSLSYAQQTDAGQDEEAVLSLRLLAEEFLSDVDWHVVVYAYMGAYPKTPAGARKLLMAAAELAVRTGGARLIVKTEAEAFRIPTIGENVAALGHATGAARRATRLADPGWVRGTETYQEARALVDAVLELDPDVGRGLVRAFDRGVLDVPYCLHPDNAGRARGYIDPNGRLCWGRTGAMPISPAPASGPRPLTAAGLMSALSFVERKWDGPPLQAEWK